MKSCTNACGLAAPRITAAVYTRASASVRAASTSLLSRARLRYFTGVSVVASLSFLQHCRESSVFS